MTLPYLTTTTHAFSLLLTSKIRHENDPSLIFHQFYKQCTYLYAAKRGFISIPKYFSIKRHSKALLLFDLSPFSLDETLDKLTPRYLEFIICYMDWYSITSLHVDCRCFRYHLVSVLKFECQL